MTKTHLSRIVQRTAYPLHTTGGSVQLSHGATYGLRACRHWHWRGRRLTPC